LAKSKPTVQKLILHDFHKKSGARFTRMQGWYIPSDYGNILAELRAGYNNLALVDRTYLGKILVSGHDKLDLLQRISTNDLSPLSLAPVSDTLFISPKGRIIDLCRVVNLGPELLLISSFHDPRPLIDWINRFIILEDVYVHDSTGEYIWLEVFGPVALDFINKIAHAGISTADENIWFTLKGKNVSVYKSYHRQIPAYNLLVPAGDAGIVYPELLRQLKKNHGRVVGERAYQMYRIHHGIPQSGTELNEEYNPLELHLQQVISFSKGCYTGQEVISRLSSYDKVQKYLMCLEFGQKITEQPPLSICLDQEIIGMLTSYIYNPLIKKYTGLGFVKKMNTLNDKLAVEIKTGRMSIPALIKIPPYIE
jgi:folate-binding protein YgfZ